MNHILYHPDKVEQNADHIPIPNSPCMRIMYMLTTGKYEEYVGLHIRNYFDQDSSPEQHMCSDLQQSDEHPEADNEPPKKKRKQAARLVTVTGS